MVNKKLVLYAGAIGLMSILSCASKEQIKPAKGPEPDVGAFLQYVINYKPSPTPEPTPTPEPLSYTIAKAYLESFSHQK